MPRPSCFHPLQEVLHLFFAEESSVTFVSEDSSQSDELTEKDINIEERLEELVAQQENTETDNLTINDEDLQNQGDMEFDEPEAISEEVREQLGSKDNETPPTQLDVKLFKIKAAKTDFLVEQLAGAELAIEDEEGNIVAEWTSGNEEQEVELPAGNFILKEKKAPKGYKKSKDIAFKVVETRNGGYTITYPNNSDFLDFASNMTKGYLETFYTKALEDFTWDEDSIKEIDENLNTAYKIIEDDKKYGINLFEVSTILIPEELRKEKLSLPERAEFEAMEADIIQKAELHWKGFVTASMETLYMFDEREEPMPLVPEEYTIAVSKVNIGGKEIAGAEIEIADKDGNTVDKWTSEEGKSHDITVKPGEYTFKEVNAPEGYEAVTEIKFTVDKDGNVTVTSTETNAAKVDEDGKLVITDELTGRNVKFSMTDIAGDELAGATIVVTGTDAAGQKVKETWESDGTAHELELPMGTYTMTETAAPNGYKIATAIDFKVNTNGTITVGKTTTKSEDKNIITMINDLASHIVSISKVDIEGQEIAGAEIKVTDKKGNIIDEWISEKGKPHEITVKPGVYVFHEESAPNGYKTVSDVTFAVDEYGNVTILDMDVNSAKIENGKLVVVDEFEKEDNKPTSSDETKPSNKENKENEKNSSKNIQKVNKIDSVDTASSTDFYLYSILLLLSFLGVVLLVPQIKKD